VAVSFVPAGQENHFRLIEKRQGQRVPREIIPGFEPAGAASSGRGDRKAEAGPKT
jgi:hypothetical protein